MQEFYGHALQPPKFGWQLATHRAAGPGEDLPAEELELQYDQEQVDFFPGDANVEFPDAFVPELPLQAPESAQTRSGNTGFGHALPTPPSYSNDTRPNFAETPEQPRHLSLSQKLPVSFRRGETLICSGKSH